MKGIIKKLLSKAGRSVLLLLYLGVMPTLCGGAIAAFALGHQEVLKSLPPSDILFINLLFAIVLALGWMPTTFFSLLSGYLWGWTCVPYVCASYILASILGYYGSLALDNGKLVAALGERFPIQKTITRIRDAGFWLTVFCRLSPVFPFAIMNAVFAMVRYPIGIFAGGGLIGMLPRTMFAIYLGQCLSHVTSMQQLRNDHHLWASVILVIVSFVGIGWIGKKSMA